MAFEVNKNNVAALEPLFKPWEEPIRHRIPNREYGGPAVITPGRRPSKCPLVRGIRAEVDGWRRGGYAGACNTSRTLLNYWFSNEHEVYDEDGNSIPFRYHWAQREAIETIIYLYEIRGIRNVANLMFEFGENQIADLAIGIDPNEDRWPKDCCKVATGGGKTKIMSLAIVWSYFHKLREINSELAQHFVVIAPNLTVYERLKDDFSNCSVFFNDPVIPDEWKSDFQVQVVLQDEPGGTSSSGTIYLTNVHRLYESRDNSSEEEEKTSIFGPPVKRAQALDTSAALRERISNNHNLMVINDEAHHMHDPDLAWNKAIDALHSQSISKGNAGICLQLDYTATPKHSNGELFSHIVCDFPLGEAVDAAIVKVPLIGESEDLQERGDRNLPASERYSMHLKLGYQRYEKTFIELSKVRKPILFVMTEDADAANEVADYLDSDQFPLLKGRVLNIHTRLKGKVKTVVRGGREIKEFIENETAMKPEDLRELREMSRELDAKDSKFRCVVSVMMLREGWDVRNVTTIIPLRPYSAKSGILPEQTLGRGLRRMFPLGDTPEVVTVVHHPAFRKLYEEELAQEGLDIAVLPLREVLKQTVTIYVDHDHKPVQELEIELPSVSDTIETKAELKGLSFDEVKQYFEQNFKCLPIGKKKEGSIEYKERHLFTDEVVASMQLDVNLLSNAWSASGYFVKMLGHACHLSNPHSILSPLIEKFLSDVLFEHKVDLFSGEVDHRMRDLDVSENIKATFTPLILRKVTYIKERLNLSKMNRISDWKPYQATSTEKRPSVKASRTMFNLVSCDNAFEQEFVDFCDFASDVVAFAKNAGPQKLMIDYMRPDKHRAFYVPDFFIRCSNGSYLLVETKGKVDNLVPVKAKAALEWCQVSSKGKAKWQYVYVPYSLFQQSAASSIAELARACDPSLKALIDEAENGQQQLPLLEATAQSEAERLFQKALVDSGIIVAPQDVQEAMQQAVHLLDYAIRSKMPDFSHAFQPLLRPLDEYAIRILEKYLRPRIPQDHMNIPSYFNPYLGAISPKQKALLEKNQRYLHHNLIFGRPIQKLGTLLFCLEYAQSGGWNITGIWLDVVGVFSNPTMSGLYPELDKANKFRNSHVAHVEQVLDDAAEAWQAMHNWFRCLDIMSKTA